MHPGMANKVGRNRVSLVFLSSGKTLMRAFECVLFVHIVEFVDFPSSNDDCIKVQIAERDLKWNLSLTANLTLLDAEALLFVPLPDSNFVLIIKCDQHFILISLFAEVNRYEMSCI